LSPPADQAALARSRALVALLAVALAGSIGLTVKAREAERSAREEAQTQRARAERAERVSRARDLSEQAGQELEALRLAVDAVAGEGAQQQAPEEASPAAIEALVSTVIAGLRVLPQGGRMPLDGAPPGPLQGQGSIILAAAFSPGGARIAAASADKTAWLWDPRDGRSIGLLQGHDGLFFARWRPRRHHERRQVGAPLGRPRRQAHRAPQGT
jgi:hypothetical protein